MFFNFLKPLILLSLLTFFISQPLSMKAFVLENIEKKGVELDKKSSFNVFQGHFNPEIKFDKSIKSTFGSIFAPKNNVHIEDKKKGTYDQ